MTCVIFVPSLSLSLDVVLITMSIRWSRSLQLCLFFEQRRPFHSQLHTCDARTRLTMVPALSALVDAC